MEPQVTAEYYKIDLTDDHGTVAYYKARLEVGDFINVINWAHVRHFSVEPVEPLASWELELMGCVEEEAAEVAKSEIVAVHPEEEEWRVIEALPIRSFEINRQGAIRHRASKRIMEQEWDIDQYKYRTLLTINGQEFSVFGPKLAESMWKEEVDAS